MLWGTSLLKRAPQVYRQLSLLVRYAVAGILRILVYYLPSLSK